MVTIEICIGSSCYVKGSDSIVMLINDIIKTHHWGRKNGNQRVLLHGYLCAGHRRQSQRKTTAYH